VAIPLVLLAAAELLLCAGGYGVPGTLFVRRDVGGVTYCTVNDAVSRRYFTNPHYAAEFLPLPAFFAVRKPAGTYRVFVLGESAAAGMCYEPFSFSCMLREQLSARRPGTRIEVINCGIDAIDSWVVREFADECLALEPDALILYCGNNEVIGPFGPASVSRIGRYAPRWFIRLRVWLTGLKLTQLAQRVSARATASGSRAAAWSNAWKRTSLERRIRREDLPMNAVADNYVENMVAITNAAAGRGVATVVCTLASNLRDFPPFSSLHRRGLAAGEMAA